jgi:3-oxoacyl-[acyl-carrier-protein] synthase III
MASERVLDFTAYGAWNGGTAVDNSVFENKGMTFKGNQPVTDASIQSRIGVRTRMAAGPNERIGVLAMKDLLDSGKVDLSKVKLVIGATNVGEDKYDPGPLVIPPYELIRDRCPEALVLDLYAGCPGFNVATELAFVLSLSGLLEEGDLSIIIGAENLHRARAFREGDTSQILFGDDSLATALETKATCRPAGGRLVTERLVRNAEPDFIRLTARAVLDLAGNTKLDGLIVDNQLGQNLWRTPACATRIQASLVEQRWPEEAAEGAFRDFKTALGFYDRQVDCFAFDIMSVRGDPRIVDRLARCYVESGKYKAVAGVFLAKDKQVKVTLHRGEGFLFQKPAYGVVDSLTRTHGCFASFIQFEREEDDVYGHIDGKGVFLYATRGAKNLLDTLLRANGLTLKDLDLLIEHQANFAMIPLTLAQVLDDGKPTLSDSVKEYIAKKMVTNIHRRGNCSVVSMQRLPYDLMRGALEPDTVQGFAVNCNLPELRKAKRILRDSVGAGMTRSAVLELQP